MQKQTASQTHDARVAFVAPHELVSQFRELARLRERTVSQELRKLMADEVERERAAGGAL